MAMKLYSFLVVSAGLIAMGLAEGPMPDYRTTTISSPSIQPTFSIVPLISSSVTVGSASSYSMAPPRIPIVTLRPTPHQLHSTLNNLDSVATVNPPDTTCSEETAAQTITTSSSSDTTCTEDSTIVQPTTTSQTSSTTTSKHHGVTWSTKTTCSNIICIEQKSTTSTGSATIETISDSCT
jgi:hypothetical protein